MDPISDVRESLHDLTELDAQQRLYVLGTCSRYENRLSQWKVQDQRAEVLKYLKSLSGTDRVVNLIDDLRRTIELVVVKTVT